MRKSRIKTFELKAHIQTAFIYKKSFKKLMCVHKLVPFYIVCLTRATKTTKSGDKITLLYFNNSILMHTFASKKADTFFQLKVPAHYIK